MRDHRIPAAALSAGFNMPVRAVSLYQRDQPGLFQETA